MYDPFDSKQQVLYWLENNRPTIKQFFEDSRIFNRLRDVYKEEPEEFHEDVKQQFLGRVRQTIKAQIAMDLGVSQDIIEEVLENYNLEELC